ncbi:DUF2946 family protein [Massilia sp. Dwa41.01b]|uniref:DUF2946 family protein n=1 Tax=unclassified Massilia TaxID=2609279 RepID=UPI0015FF75EC|nr:MULTISPECIES: DUF2946 family protein [unclassified Massilia]QNA90571.1 DUF2946 family protein [Massilia sp. Dwa41.01b]QNA97802.1 DUF2946 family protein [Massilia sp. Se16.2.3]
MDDIVKQAMAKWPNVPNCYGWLALDARGNWRMRDEAAQAANAPGDRLNNPTLVGFINRNYGHDEAGRWYFQNGPQRVYVNLESTPYIARTDPAQGLVLQTGAALETIERLYLLENGEAIVQAGDIVAQLDDRDVAQLFEDLELDGQPAGDEALLAWLGGGAGTLVLRWRGARVPVERIARASLAQHFGFDPLPRPPASPAG